MEQSSAGDSHDGMESGTDHAVWLIVNKRQQLIHIHPNIYGLVQEKSKSSVLANIIPNHGHTLLFIIRKNLMI